MCVRVSIVSAVQICEAFNANRYPFPEDPARQRQMHGEVSRIAAVCFAGLLSVVTLQGNKPGALGVGGLHARIATPGSGGRYRSWQLGSAFESNGTSRCGCPCAASRLW